MIIFETLWILSYVVYLFKADPKRGWWSISAKLSSWNSDKTPYIVYFVVDERFIEKLSSEEEEDEM